MLTNILSSVFWQEKSEGWANKRDKSAVNYLVFELGLPFVIP